MATIPTNFPRQPNHASQAAEPPPTSEGAVRKLDPRLKQVKSLVDQGNYQRAFEAVPTQSSDVEVINCRAVCLMRLGKFSQAIAPLRRIALNTSTFHLRREAPEHIKINYAIALFFGGEAAGGMEALSDIKREDDPQVKMIREQAKVWMASMNWLRRLDWFFNRVAPRRGPAPPPQPVGYFAWEIPEELRSSREI